MVEEQGASALLKGGFVEAETPAAINWSIMARCSAVKATVPGPCPGDSPSGREVAGPEVSHLSSSPIDPEKRACHQEKENFELGDITSLRLSTD